MEQIENHLSVDFRAYLRLFAFYIYNCSFHEVCFVHPMPEYHSTLETKGNFFGQIFAVFINSAKEYPLIDVRDEFAIAFRGDYFR